MEHIGVLHSIILLVLSRELRNGMMINSWYGSFPHSLRLAPVSYCTKEFGTDYLREHEGEKNILVIASINDVRRGLQTTSWYTYYTDG